MDSERVISILNDLILTCKDGEQGFRTCAEHTDEPKLKSFFMNRADSCASASQELQQCVRHYGGEPLTNSSISGTLHRRWIDLKSVFTGNDERQVLAECERGEDLALESYRAARREPLPPDVLALVERQYQGVENNYNQVRTLLEQTRARG